MRLRWYSGPSLFGLGVIAFLVVLGFFTHSAFGLAAFMAVVWAWSKFGMKIELTSTDVGLRQWPLRSSSAPREPIKAMHWYSQSFTFVDDDHRLLLKIGGLGWTGSQLLYLSQRLGVPLYNHRTKHELGTDASKGQLIQRCRCEVSTDLRAGPPAAPGRTRSPRPRRIVAQSVGPPNGPTRDVRSAARADMP